MQHHKYTKKGAARVYIMPLLYNTNKDSEYISYF